MIKESQNNRVLLAFYTLQGWNDVTPLIVNFREMGQGTILIRPYNNCSLNVPLCCFALYMDIFDMFGIV